VLPSPFFRTCCPAGDKMSSWTSLVTLQNLGQRATSSILNALPSLSEVRCVIGREEWSHLTNSGQLPRAVLLHNSLWDGWKVFLGLNHSSKSPSTHSCFFPVLLQVLVPRTLLNKQPAHYTPSQSLIPEENPSLMGGSRVLERWEEEYGPMRLPGHG
jgi:hypothetical protein